MYNGTSQKSQSLKSANTTKSNLQEDSPTESSVGLDAIISVASPSAGNLCSLRFLKYARAAHLHQEQDSVCAEEMTEKSSPKP